ncbi:hypothetical protein C1N74_11645 [Microbacterium sp. SGAir0570]|uniref:hypothetical protein n=1 Tax=unclassified Microbacterium TaxID=2609290 RepID=UPI000CDE2CF7|nr:MULTISPECIES: hypothetical protein [unclassified Microbacterium]POX66358.1 hypothetical protein C3481_10340 [Microbacterium sp. Ru50]QCR40997.1 hypothetical protein C1N74_11645 [Microbacterium sp. SGAir0570]
MTGIVLRRRISVPAILAFALLTAGCATPGVGGAAAPSPPPTPSETLSPTTHPEPSGTPHSATPPVSSEPTPRLSTSDLLDACLVAVRDENAPASEQLDRSTIERERARSALRPDGLWYVVVPVTDPTVDAPLEYACLLTGDMTVDASWGRITPDADDFEQWSTATEPDQGT